MGQRSYTVEYCSDAVKLAKELGASVAAQQLKIPADTLYTWISRAKKGDLPMSPTSPKLRASMNLAERVKELEREIKALRGENEQIQRGNQMLEDAAAFFAARRKK